MVPNETEGRKPWEINIGLGFGNAVCAREDEAGQCPVDGAGTFYVGGGYRFTPNWAIGLELAAWGYEVRDEWRGQITEDLSEEPRFGSSYLAIYGRWYWFDRGTMDPYLHFGLGAGSFQGEAKSETDEYKTVASGWVLPFGIGIDWQVAEVFKLGPQLLAYFHKSTRICETLSGDETCRDPGTDSNGDPEGRALPWRLNVQGSFTF